MLITGGSLPVTVRCDAAQRMLVFMHSRHIFSGLTIKVSTLLRVSLQGIEPHSLLSRHPTREDIV